MPDPTANTAAPVRTDHVATPATFLAWLDQFSWLKDVDPVRQAVAEVFNPPDDDEDETLILLRALFAARDFIAATPCACSWPDPFVEPCERCLLLGRIGDERQDR